MAQTYPSKTLTVSIDCPPEQVYRYVHDAQNLPNWATAFVRSVERTDKGWVVQTPMGALDFRFVPDNTLGVLDHVVTVSPGKEVLNPMRVVTNGSGSEVMFTLLQRPDMSAAQFAEDAGMVERDLRMLKQILERA